MTDSNLWSVFLRFTEAHSPAHRRRIVEQHPELQAVRTSELLAVEVERLRHQGLVEGAAALARAIDFFERCRLHGVEAAFAQDHATMLPLIRRDIDALVAWLDRSPTARGDESAVHARCQRLNASADLPRLEAENRYVVRLSIACLALEQATQTSSLPMIRSVHTELEQLVALATPGTVLHWQARERLAASLAKLFDLERDSMRVDALDHLIDSMQRTVPLHARWLALANLRAGFAHAARCASNGSEADLRKAQIHSQRAIDGPLDPIDAWNANNVLGTLYRQLHERHGDRSDLDAAIEHSDRAWNQAPNQAYRCAAVVNLAAALCARYQLLHDASALDRAIKELRATLDLLRVTGRDWCFIAHNLATAQRLRGDESLDEAIALHDQVVTSTAEIDPQFALFAGGLANAHWQRFCRDMSLDDLDRSISVYTRAIDHVPSAEMEQVRLLNNLALALYSRFEINRKMGDLDCAITASKRSLSALPQSAPAWGDTLCNLGGYLTAKYELSLDENDFTQSLEYLASATGAMSTSPRLGNLRFSQAAALLAHHHVRNDGADLDRAIDLIEGVLNENPAPALVDSYMSTLAAALATRHQRDGMPSDALRAQELFELCLSPHRPLSTHLRLSTALHLAHWSFERAVQAEAKGESAIVHWDQAVRAFDLTGGISEQALQVSLDHRHQRDLLYGLQQVAARYAYACWKLGIAERAVEVLESERGRLLSQALDVDGLSTARLAAAGRPELANRFNAALRALRVAEQTADTQDGTLKDQLAQGTARMRMRSALDECVGEIRRVVGFEDFLMPMHIEDIQATLAREAQLVYLLVTSAGGLALLVTSNDVTGIELSFALRDLRQLLLPEALGKSSPGYLSAVVENPRDRKITIERAAMKLGVALIAPLLPRLQAAAVGSPDRKPPLYLIPTGHLSVLPLHAAASKADAIALIDRFTVSLLPSARLLKRPAAPAHPAAGALLVVGDPTVLTGSPELPGARFEAIAIARLSTAATRLLVGDAASAEAVRSAWAHAETVHLACHGSFDPIDPMRSRLLLAGNDELSLGRIVADSMSYVGPHHVVMSACQTALSDLVRLPEEVIGFPVAFLQAGAQTTVGTLWPIGDWPSSILMAKFTIGTNSGASPARALSDAQCWLRDAAPDQLKEFAEALLADWPTEDATAFRQHLSKLLASNSGAQPFRSPVYWAGFVCWGRI